MGKLFVTAFVIALIGVYFVAFPPTENETDLQPINFQKPTELTQEKETEACIQVITPARNPETGAIVEFPTPCDVPDNWTPIEPEGLDLQAY